jgi:hypothetical protein
MQQWANNGYKWKLPAILIPEDWGEFYLSSIKERRCQKGVNKVGTMELCVLFNPFRKMMLHFKVVLQATFPQTKINFP